MGFTSQERPDGLPATADISQEHQLARVEALLATVNYAASALGRCTDQLRSEVDLLAAGARAAQLAEALNAALIENRQLREALEARAAIEQAKGILVARCGCTPEDAFERLRELSVQQRRKVRELAQEIVRSRGRWMPLTGSSQSGAAPGGRTGTE